MLSYYENIHFLKREYKEKQSDMFHDIAGLNLVEKEN